MKNKKLIFLTVYITIIIISDLTINIRTTVLKKGVLRSVLIVNFKELTCGNRQRVHRSLMPCLFDSTVIRVNLEHLPLDINL